MSESLEPFLCPPYILYDQLSCTPEKDLFEHPPFDFSLAYESFLTPDWSHYPITFTCPKLNLAAQCLKHFDDREALQVRWYFVTVSETALKFYYDYVMQDRRNCVLPFWCWCSEDDDSLEPQRHMIAIYPVDFCVKRKKRSYFKHAIIDSTKYLLGVLLHISTRDEDYDCITCHCIDHFYINLSLPKCAKLILSSLYQGEFQKILYAMLEAQLTDSEVAFSLFPMIQDPGYLPVKALRDIPKGLVLPVPKDMKPCRTPTSFAFYFLPGHTLYFIQDKSLLNLDEEAWSKYQTQLGNRFLDTIQDELLQIGAYYLTYQSMLCLLNPFQTQRHQLEQSINALKNQTPNFQHSPMAYVRYDQEPCAPEKDHLGHSRVFSPYAYTSFLEPHWPQYRTTFSCPKLDAAAKATWHFEARDALQERWYHVTVSEARFDRFYYRVREHPRIRLLPFWSWCDGGPEKTLHRHMIAIFPMDSPHRTEGTYREIEGKPHLIDTILHLSGWGDKQSTCRKENLFYINWALPQCAKGILFCLWKGGLQHLLEVMLTEQLMNPSDAIALFPMIEKLWYLPVKALKGLPKRLVLPVLKNMKPSTTPTPLSFHFINNYQLCFTKDDTLLDLDEDTWWRCQAECGNCVLDTIQNERLMIKGCELNYHKMLKFVKCFQKEIKMLEKKKLLIEENKRR